MATQLAPFRLRWQRSWPQRDADFTGSHATQPARFARIYREERADREKLWRWTVIDNQRHVSDGFAPDADAAARAAEVAYFDEDRGAS